MTEPAKGTKGTQRTARYPKKLSQRYVIAPKPGYLLPPAVEPAGDRVVDRLKADREINVLRVISPAERMGPPAPTIVVADMPPDRAMQLASSPDLLIEPDQPLRYGTATVPVADPGLVPFTETAEITVRVENSEGEAVQGAEVRLLATTSSGPALTDRSGNATLTLAASELPTVAGLLIQPREGYWSAWRPWPQLSATDTNHVVCQKIEVETAGTWPRRVMGFDRLPPTYRGHGVKVAIIDSGASDATEQVSGGYDIVAQDGKSWQQDLTGFGTAIAGLISGLAPEAELHVLKVFPGGHVSDLFEAIEHCITAQVDLIALNLGTGAPSWLIARKIEEAREFGISCITAAGSNAGQISFPATMPSVLSVGAIGKLGTFPPDSYHATQFIGEQTPDGMFPARFSGYGPQIDLCAPGVAVVTPNTVRAIDGTAVAVGHVASLAALVLAHHPEFAGVREHGRLRVERLYSVLRASCQPLPFSDRLKVGWGMPDAVTALGLSRSAWAPGNPVPFMMPQPVMGR